MDPFDRLDAYFAAHPEVSQADFGTKVGAWQSVVSLWRRRERKPGLQYLPKLNALLGTTLDEWSAVKLSRRRRSKRAA